MATVRPIFSTSWRAHGCCTEQLLTSRSSKQSCGSVGCGRVRRQVKLLHQRKIPTEYSDAATVACLLPAALAFFTSLLRGDVHPRLAAAALAVLATLQGQDRKNFWAYMCEPSQRVQLGLLLAGLQRTDLLGQAKVDATLAGSIASLHMGFAAEACKPGLSTLSGCKADVTASALEAVHACAPAVPLCEPWAGGSWWPLTLASACLVRHRHIYSAPPPPPPPARGGCCGFLCAFPCQQIMWVSSRMFPVW